MFYTLSRLFWPSPVSRDFLAFERPDGLSQAKKSLETGLSQKESGRSAKNFFVPAPIKYDLYFASLNKNITFLSHIICGANLLETAIFLKVSQICDFPRTQKEIILIFI